MPARFIFLIVSLVASCQSFIHFSNHFFRVTTKLHSTHGGKSICSLDANCKSEFLKERRANQIRAQNVFFMNQMKSFDVPGVIYMLQFDKIYPIADTWEYAGGPPHLSTVWSKALNLYRENRTMSASKESAIPYLSEFYENYCSKMHIEGKTVSSFGDLVAHMFNNPVLRNHSIDNIVRIPISNLDEVEVDLAVALCKELPIQYNTVDATL